MRIGSMMFVQTGSILWMVHIHGILEYGALPVILADGDIWVLHSMFEIVRLCSNQWAMNGK